MSLSISEVGARQEFYLLVSQSHLSLTHTAQCSLSHSDHSVGNLVRDQINAFCSHVYRNCWNDFSGCFNETEKNS